MLGKSLSHITIKFKMKLHVIILKMQQICFLYFFIATLAIWMHNLNGAALLLFEPPEPDWSFLLNGLQIAAAATVARCWMQWHPCIHAFRHGDTCSPCLNGRAYLGGGYSLKRERDTVQHVQESFHLSGFTYVEVINQAKSNQVKISAQGFFYPAAANLIWLIKWL